MSNPPPSLLSLIAFWLCVAACAVGQAALVRDAVRRAAPVRELAWTFVPALGLALLLGATWGVLS